MSPSVETLQLPPPKGIDHWRQLLSPQKLTLLPGSYERIKRALQAASSNADKVAAAIAEDPAACLHFYLRGNRLVARTGNEIHSLPHLVSLLGFAQCTQLLAALPVAERPLPLYWRQLQESQLRAATLHALCQIQPALQEYHFAVLFSGLGRWLLWHQGAREQLNAEGLARNPRIGPVRALQLVFGKPLPVNDWLAKEALPGALLAALKLSPHERLQAVRRILREQAHQQTVDANHRAAMVVFLLDELVRRFVRQPAHVRTRRCARLLAHQLGIGHDRLLCLLHRCAGSLPILHPSLSDQHPARGLLCHVSTWPDLPVYALPSAERAPAAPPPTADAPKAVGSARLLDNRFSDAARVKQELNDLARGHERLQSLNHLLTSWQAACEQGMGMTHCAVLIPDKTNALWHTRFQSAGTELGSFGNTALLDRMCLKSGSVLINADNRDGMLPHLPPALAALCQTQELLLHSVLFRQKPVAILLCAEADLSPPRIRAVKQLTAALQTAIERLAMQVRRKAATG